MSAFVLSDDFFGKLGDELAMRAISRGDRFNHAVMKFLGLENGLGHSYSVERIETEANEMAQALLAANIGAVNARYRERATPKDVRPSVARSHWNDFQLLKHLQCLRYQMTEGDVPEWAIYRKLKDFNCALAEVIVAGLPESEAAKWGA